jgi:2-methylaconitate cis-trans-isomerase PrpF
VVTIEHPTGSLEVECEGAGSEFTTSVTRTARLLFRGHVYIPAAAVEAADATGHFSE